MSFWAALHVILGTIFCSQSMLGVCEGFERFFPDFTGFFPDFTGFCPDFHQIKTFGVRFHPRLLH